MKSKNTAIFGLTIVILVFLVAVGCMGGNDNQPKGIATIPSAPTPGSDTLTAVFSGTNLTGKVYLSAATLSALREAHSGSSGDTLMIYLAKGVCQPGSSGDTCFGITSYNYR